MLRITLITIAMTTIIASAEGRRSIPAAKGNRNHPSNQQGKLQKNLVLSGVCARAVNAGDAPSTLKYLLENCAFEEVKFSPNLPANSACLFNGARGSQVAVKQANGDWRSDFGTLPKNAKGSNCATVRKNSGNSAETSTEGAE